MIPMNNPAITAIPPDIGTKGVFFLFWSFTISPIFLRYFISHGVKYKTTKNDTIAEINGSIVIEIIFLKNFYIFLFNFFLFYLLKSYFFIFIMFFLFKKNKNASLKELMKYKKILFI